MSICHKNHEMPLCLNCPKFGQLIIRKIIRIVATVKFLGVKMHKIGLRLGLRPRRHLRSLQRSSGPWLHLRGPISKGRGGEGVNEGEKESRKRVWAPNLHHRSTPLDIVHEGEGQTDGRNCHCIHCALPYGVTLKILTSTVHVKL